MAKAVKIKEPVKKEMVEAKAVDFSKPGFSNVTPDSPQAKPFKRVEPLPSQENKK